MYFIKRRLLEALTIVLFTIATQGIAVASVRHWEALVNASDTWSYFEGNSPVPGNWNTLAFNDSNWKTGQGGLGYGDGDDATTVEQANSLFLRKKFEVSKLSSIEELLFYIDYDDGFIAYLNGVEIARSLMAGDPPAYDALSIDQHEAEMYQGGMPDKFLPEASWKQVLKEGENVLAIQVHNSSVGSSDMSAIPFLFVGINDNSHLYQDTPDWFEESVPFTSSNLPIILIDTEDGGGIRDEPKTNAIMKIINHKNGEINSINDTPTDYDGHIGIEIRGSSSAGYPQKPYGIETRDELGENNNVAIMEMPEENDWILLANYNDKSFMRNTLSFHLFEKMGHYAPRTKTCEVLINGEYQGIYIFTEKIKVDDNRVDIGKLKPEDNEGDELTGGYIFKVDYTDSYSWRSNFSPIDRRNGTVYFTHQDPKGEDITEQQQEYLANHIDEFETALYSNDFKDPEHGYRSYINVQSFIDYFIMGEISRNVDAYKKSRYLYKEKDSDGGLLYSGPVWDYDWAWKNLNDCYLLQKQDGSGWAYQINRCNVSPTPPAWIVRFLEDPYFEDRLFTRYTDLRKTILSMEYIEAYADSFRTMVSDAQKRHYKRWPILGQRVGAPENDDIPSTYAGEVRKLVDWIETRLNWLDENMTGNYVNVIDNSYQDNIAFVYPNPAKDLITIKSEEPFIQVELYAMNGSRLKRIDAYNVEQLQINTEQLRNGLYVLRLTHTNQSVTVQKFEIRR